MNRQPLRLRARYHSRIRKHLHGECRESILPESAQHHLASRRADTLDEKPSDYHDDEAEPALISSSVFLASLDPLDDGAKCDLAGEAEAVKSP